MTRKPTPYWIQSRSTDAQFVEECYELSCRKSGDWRLAVHAEDKSGLDLDAGSDIEILLSVPVSSLSEPTASSV